MRIITAKLSDLRPIQEAISLLRTRARVLQLKKFGYLPIPVIENCNGLLMGDGHHTGAALYLLKQDQNNPLVNIVVLESDIDVKNWKRGAFWNLSDLATVQQAFSLWHNNLAKHSQISRIGDIFYQRYEQRGYEVRVRELPLSEIIGKKQGYVPIQQVS